MMNRWRSLLLAIAASSFAIQTLTVLAEEDFRPSQDSLPVPVPEGAIVLLENGEHQFLSMKGEAINWPWQDDSLVSTRGGGNKNHIVSKWHFRDADIHVEFLLPEKGSGNSGIYIHGNYELQVIDSYGKEQLTQDDLGALYGFSPPLVNAARPRDQWQVYDIRYHAPRRNDDGKIIEPGTVTAWLNGQLVQDHTRFEEPRSVYHPFRYGTTPYLKAIWGNQLKTGVGPVFLQDHGNAVRFRNVWVRPLDDLAREYRPQEQDAQ
ncbi:MAG: DUF1080 domain-containing protein [Pirellulaceae bacterium]